MPVTAKCPSCGGEVPVASRASRVAACPFCASTLIVNEQAIRALGKMALLAETPSCLAVGWPARCLGREIHVLGRLQYQYDAGLWDEWWVRFADDGSHAWISQDEGEYMLETALNAGNFIPDYDSVEPGDQVRLGTRRLWVREKNQADMAGLQGEIPLEAAPGRTMRYLDLTDGRRIATIEYFEDGSALSFDGKRLGPRDLESSVAPSESEHRGKAPYPPPRQRRPRKKVVTSAESFQPQAVNCPSCGGKVVIRSQRGTAMAVCEHCGAALDVSAPGRVQLLYEAERKKRPFPIEIGARGKLRGADYMAIGRVRYQEIDESGTYVWDALQLYNPERGYAFLELENGHWLLFTPLRHPVRFDPRHAEPRTRISYQGQTYRVFERSAARITYVEGELSWVARLGDRVNYMDAIRPPHLLSAEWTDREIEWSLGAYMTPDEIVAAFNLPAQKRTDPIGVAPAQPFERSRGQRRRAWSAVLVAAVLLVLGVFAWMREGEPVFAESAITSDQYLSESGYLSPVFEIPEGSHCCKLTVSSRGLDNSWVALSVAFLDEQQNVLLDADATVEYYHGYEGGGSWSEGSRSDYALVRLDGPQRYRLNVFGEAGTWSPGAGDRSTTRGAPIDLTVARDIIPARYFLTTAILAALYPLWEFGRQVLFETRRWPSEED